MNYLIEQLIVFFFFFVIVVGFHELGHIVGIYLYYKRIPRIIIKWNGVILEDPNPKNNWIIIFGINAGLFPLYISMLFLNVFFIAALIILYCIGIKSDVEKLLT